jgi:hypothetical protein
VASTAEIRRPSTALATAHSPLAARAPPMPAAQKQISAAASTALEKIVANFMNKPCPMARPDASYGANRLAAPFTNAITRKCEPA